MFVVGWKEALDASVYSIRMSKLDTRATLLFRVRDSLDHDSWSEFLDLYMPLVYSYCLNSGLQEADAADVAQDTLLLVVKALPTFRYDSERGSFRGWLLTILRNVIRRRCQQAKNQSIGSGDSAILNFLHEQPSREDIDKWEREYQLRMFHWAASKIQNTFRSSTWNAFWLTTVEGISIHDAAARLGITEGAVYIARSRVLSRIRQEIEFAENVY